MPEVLTVGVYRFTGGEFIAALQEAGVAKLIDVRQRRGVRGPDYAWANSKRLQSALAEAGIDYEHRKDLAPTTAMRQMQYREDDRLGEGKRSRTKLAGPYVEAYSRDILDPADLDSLVEALPAEGPAALLCVEADPEACHRSLIAERLASEHGLEVGHIRPG